MHEGRRWCNGRILFGRRIVAREKTGGTRPYREIVLLVVHRCICSDGRADSELILVTPACDFEGSDALDRWHIAYKATTVWIIA